MMIPTDGYGLLNHVQTINWLEALAAYFIDKEKESSRPFDKAFLSPTFIYYSIRRTFPRQIH